jgi:hypothetical protein
LLVQNLFHSSSTLTLHHSLTALFTIAEHSYLAFEDGPPIFMQVFSDTT